MARRRFGADLTAVAWRTVTVDGTDDIVQLAAAAGGITAWSAQTSGSQITDLTDSLGVALPSGNITSDAFGLIDFNGPDTDPETVTLWLDAGLGERQQITASDVAAQVVNLAGTVATNVAAIAVNAAAISGHESRITVLEAGGGGGGGGGAAGVMLLDSFSGATDDLKLDTASITVAAQTYPAAIGLTNRQYNSSVGNRNVFTGQCLIGPPGAGNAEVNGQTKMKSRFHLTMNGPWWVSGPATTYGVTFDSLALTGGSQATFLGHTSGTMRNLNIRNITAVNLRSLLGTQATKLLLTSPIFNGWWEINATYNGAIHIGGSGESILWPDGGIFDGGGEAYNVAGSSTGQATIWLDYFEQGNIGPIFVTCEDGWNGVRVDGPAYNASGGSSNSGGPVRFWGTTIEGRNASQPCWGSLVRVLGGIVQMNGVGLLHAMSNPSAMGHSPADGAGVDIGGSARVVMRDCGWDRWTGQAEASPFVVVRSGSRLRVEEALTTMKGGIWTGLPRVQVLSGGTLVHDGTVTQI